MMKYLLANALATTNIHQSVAQQFQSNADHQSLIDRYAALLRSKGSKNTGRFRLANSEEPNSTTISPLRERLNQLLAIGIRSRYSTEGVPEQLAAEMDRQLGGDLTYCDPDKGCSSPVNLDGIWGYGCWCNFGEDLLLGSAEPVNRFDAICKNMQQCLRCAKMDGEKDGYECDPKTKSYDSGFSWLPAAPGLNAECGKLNPGDACATHACTCEVDMINELISTIWEMHVYEPQFKHPVFDRDENCPTNPSEVVKSCCGYYPDRFPFNTANRSCCPDDQRLFNSMHRKREMLKVAKYDDHMDKLL